MQFSIVIAIYNRPDELQTLLTSLQMQSETHFEVIVVDDGSTQDLSPIIEDFKLHLNLIYRKKNNSGPGLSRNFGANLAQGDFLIFLDSDCIVPIDYLKNIKKNLLENPVDAFGGADKAHKNFNSLQKAISYSMTSLLTTGGVRGSVSTKNFQPRSFNMGVQKYAFSVLGGFSEMRVGEDPDLSMRLWESGFSTAFFPNIEVYHQRRNSWKSFAKQVYQFGVARPILNLLHPKYVKISFWFPSVFLLGFVLSSFLVLFNFPWFLMFYALYFVGVFLHSSIQNSSVLVGFKSVLASAIQFFSYGLGFLNSFIRVQILKQDPKKAFPTHFYKKN